MRFIVLNAGLPLALLSGCAGLIQNAQPGPDHPASPFAADAPLLPRSQTLAVDTSAAPRTEAEDMVPPQVQPPGGPAATAGGHDHAAMQATSPENMSRSGSATQGVPTGRGGTSPTAPSGALYACPMHPEVTSTSPNERCPKCGMKINKPVKPAATAPAAAPAAGNAPAQHEHDHHGGDK